MKSRCLKARAAWLLFLAEYGTFKFKVVCCFQKDATAFICSQPQIWCYEHET